MDDTSAGDANQQDTGAVNANLEDMSLGRAHVAETSSPDTDAPETSAAAAFGEHNAGNAAIEAPSSLTTAPALNEADPTISLDPALASEPTVNLNADPTLSLEQSSSSTPTTPASPATPPSGKRRRSRRNSALELLLIIGVAIGLAYLIQAYVVKPYRIPSGSMEPTLQIGQRVLVNRIGMNFETPHVGEIAVFHPPEGAEQQLCGGPQPTGSVCDKPENKESNVNFIKRIVAGPGDTISIKNGLVVLNGKLQSEPFTAPCGDVSECNYPTPVKIPPGHWFMMGDNRGDSDDSRYWGPVPESWIIGEAFATYWPPDRIGTL